MLKKNTFKICIIGMPGSGKSSVGKILSKKLSYKFYDTDNEIEILSKLKIKDIFKDHGELKFRDLESKILKRLIKMNKVVISTGGGIILKNQKILSNSFNIYLKCGLDTLIERASRNKKRPLLLKDVENNMKNLFNQRKAIYNEISDLNINATDKLHTTVKDILDKLPK